MFLHSSLYHRRLWLRALQAGMMLYQFGLMGAYAVRSCRNEAMSAYVFVLVALVASYVLVFALLTPSVHGGDMNTPDGSGERAHKYLLIFATLVATMTYQAGLSTPGGFWPGSQAKDHFAGDILLRVHQPTLFVVFFYFNKTAFVASLVVVMLLMSKTVTQHRVRSYALWVCTAAAMVGLMGAFAAWSCRSVKTSIYAVLFYNILKALVFFCEPVKNLIRDVQIALEGYLKFQRMEHQQSRAFEHSNCDAYQILRKSQMYLLLLGILAASGEHQAGLNACQAGDPILYITYPRRYLAFFHSNFTAFIAWLLIFILLLSNTSLCTEGIKYCALILDLIGLIGAYGAGSSRQVSNYVYVGIVVLVFMLELFPAWAARRQAIREKMEQCDPGWLKEVLGRPDTESENMDTLVYS